MDVSGDDLVPMLVDWNYRQAEQRLRFQADSVDLAEARDLILYRCLAPEVELPVLQEGVPTSYGTPVPWVAAPAIERPVLELLRGPKSTFFSVAREGQVFPNFVKGFHLRNRRIPVAGLSPLLDHFAERLQDHRRSDGGRLQFASTRLFEGEFLRAGCGRCGHLLGFVVDEGRDPDLGSAVLFSSLKAPCHD
ncbi:hypothetical protein [Nocardioides alcanivorans]|uniref:hypothetical protein n=1 Tax=Nocardioides alcanivorans TaxID=2897352 RepID=UPI001F308933|nr:hypothetical protein [Nocardioides alcanivorans]